jgi:hypothetical protein
MYKGISVEKLEMAHPPTAENDEGEKQANNGHDPEVGRQMHPAEVSGQSSIEIDLPKVPDQELEAGEGGESLSAEFDMQRTIDTAGQIRFSSSH